MRTSTSPARVALAASLLLACAAPLAAQGGDSSDAPPIESFRHEAAGIDFYVEKSGDGPPVVLVPSGQGDCGAYRYLADTLASDFTVITFDMPGFSRSGPPPTWDGMSAATLGNQVAALVESLGITEATFYGSSSGGVAVLALVADHPGLVRHAIVHEPAIVSDVPLTPFNEAFATWFPKVNSQRDGPGAARRSRPGLDPVEALPLHQCSGRRRGGDPAEGRRVTLAEGSPLRGAFVPEAGGDAGAPSVQLPAEASARGARGRFELRPRDDADAVGPGLPLGGHGFDRLRLLPGEVPRLGDARRRAAPRSRSWLAFGPEAHAGRRLHRLAQHLAIADVVGEQQDQADVQRVAFVLRAVPVKIKEFLEEAVAIEDVGFGPESGHGSSVS